tara:strand:+ start:658 stop:948 length:291 start_codon:yes stop_codon:yes gene_type:complete
MTIAGDMKDIAASLPSRNGFSELEELLRARGIDSINNAGWSSIDSQELQAGRISIVRSIPPPAPFLYDILTDSFLPFPMIDRRSSRKSEGEVPKCL